MLRADRLKSYFMQPRSAVGLAAFRILYSLTLLCEVLQLIWLRHLVYDPLPYLVPPDWPIDLLLFCWPPVILCILVGLWTRSMTIVNYVLTVMTFGMTDFWEYHVDYTYCGVNLFLIFMPIERAMSFDARRRLNSQTHTSLPIRPSLVPRIHYDALIFVGIALVYFDSVFYKLASDMWTSGLGVWRPASLPHNTWWNVGWLLDFKLPMLTLGYVTVVFECLFPFVMWIDRVRPLLLVIGLGLHLGIIVMFPIPWFGLAMVSLYLLMIPDNWWVLLGDRIPQLGRLMGTSISNEDASPAEHSTTHRSPRFAGVQAAIIGGLTVLVTISQLLQTAEADLTKDLTRNMGGESLRRVVAGLASRYGPATRRYYGVTRHPVFMDFHFDGYEAFYTAVHVDAEGEQTWLPMATKDGLGRLGWSGRLWVNWTWRVSNPQPNPSLLSRGMQLSTAWWLGQQGLDHNDAQFVIMRRECDPCEGWTKGYYQAQLEHDWRPVGTVQWTKGECEVTLDPAALTPAVESPQSELKPVGSP